jgi:hypothetical protein
MWRPNSIGQVIAQRELDFNNSEGVKKVILRVGQPVRSHDAQKGEPWWCPIEIEGLGARRLDTIAGEDALQSLLLALQFSKRMLPEYAKKTGGHIYWLSEEMDSIFDQQNMIDVYSVMAGEAFQVLRDVKKKIQETKSTDMRDASTQIELLLQKYKAEYKQ